MGGIGASLIDLLDLLPKIPESATCGECGWFDPTHPKVIERAELLGHDVGLVACRCDMIAEEARDVEDRRRKDANLPARDCSFGNFTLRPGDGIKAAFKAAQVFAQNEGPQVLVFLGGTGTGKSHLLEAIGRAVLARGGKAHYEHAIALVDRLRFSNAPGQDQSSVELMKWIQDFPTLLIDDLGAERTTDYAVEKITELFEDRLMNGGRIAFATNLGVTAITDAYGPRLASRLFDVSDAERSLILPIDAEDYRSLRHG